MKNLFVLLLLIAAPSQADRFDVNACVETGVLDISPDGSVLGCWEEIVEPPPPPPPPPSGDIDPPILRTDINVGGPFTDCGSPGTTFRSPSPTDTQHALEDVGLSGYSNCVLDLSGWPYYMTNQVVISGSDKEVRFGLTVTYPIIIRNAQRIAITGSASTVPVCENSSHVSFNGQPVQGCEYP